MGDVTRLKIVHRTSYHYEDPLPYALQQLRLTPKSRGSQKVLSWTTHLDGATQQLTFEDAHMNTVLLISSDAGAKDISIVSEGEVEVEDTNGVVGNHQGYMPLWIFKRPTALTKPGPLVRKLARDVTGEDGDLARLHALSEALGEAVKYTPGHTDAATPAEDALALGKGVCQDHAHIFVSAARHLDIPARYVSGYLMMEGQDDQDATHAWAEAFVDGVGWIGFDVSNEICPDGRYVRVATGLDYGDAAPISGMRFGEGEERLQVAVQVQQ